MVTDILAYPKIIGGKITFNDMAEADEGVQIKTIIDFSGGVQRKSSRFLQKENEVNVAENITFDLVGAASKRTGYSQIGSDLTSTTSTSTSTSTTSTSTSSSTSTSTSTSTTTTA